MVCLVKVTEDWNQVTPVEFVARCSTEQVCSEKQVCYFQKFLGAPTQYLGTCISFLGSFLTILLDITFTRGFIQQNTYYSTMYNESVQVKMLLTQEGK